MNSTETKQITFRLSLAGSTARFVALLALSIPLITPTSSFLPASFTLRSAFAQEGVEPAKRSNLVAIALPGEAVRATSKEHLAQFTEALGTLAKSSHKEVRKVEVLLWQGTSAKKTVPGLLKEKGYTYSQLKTVDVEGGTATNFTITRKGQDDLVGLWMERENVLLLAWASVAAPEDTVKAEEPAPSEDATKEEAPSAPARPSSPAANDDTAAPANAITVTLNPQMRDVNVMKSAMPKLPTFPKLAKKSGYVRGYVYDVNGKPLKGARLGVRSTVAGGFYSGASARTDAKGYYEIAVPWGAAHFYRGGYAIPYGEGQAALSLHPANGDLEGFASANGAVENFVLLSYGIARPDEIQDNSRYSGNYYGGTFVIDWHVDEDERWHNAQYLPVNSSIEITLTPTGPLADGSKGRPIVIRKNVGNISYSQLYVNNVPIGAYKISAKIVGGKALKMRETGMYSSLPFGLEGKEAVGSAGFTFRPGSGNPDMAAPRLGNWNSLCVTLEMP